MVLCACVSWTGDGGDEQGGLLFSLAVLRIAPSKYIGVSCTLPTLGFIFILFF